MSSTIALPQTLKSITATKITEISKNAKLFEQRKDEVLQAANTATDLRTKATILLEGMAWVNGNTKGSFAVDRDDEDIDLDFESGEDTHASILENAERNIKRFLLQRKYDNSVSDELLREWTAQLEKKLELTSVRYNHAVFYSDLVTDWLSDLGGHTVNGSDSDGTVVRAHDENIADSEFEKVGRAEMHEQREIWESLVFKAAEVDMAQLEGYLNDLFASTKLTKQALKELREHIQAFGLKMMTDTAQLTVATLQAISESLLTSDILSSEKAAVLKEFMRNNDVASEVVDVLRLRLASLDTWKWEAESIPLEMRRQLNGKYRVFMDEDLIDALMLQYLGLQWSTAFRSVFRKFLHSPAWKSNSKPIPREQLRRRHHYLRDSTYSSVAESGNVHDNRRRKYEDEYFMSQLPESLEDGSYDYDGDNVGGNGTKDAVKTKHSLLHLLITESLIHGTLRNEFTVVRSDFKWFGPSLPHDVILTVLQFFGVTDDWLSFFRRFLEAPLKFIQDGPQAKIQFRKRGVPISHALSDCFGEVVLFCMDYTVNQHAHGQFLYRLHDDFWFWGDEETCRKAWKAMGDFASMMSLNFNEEKTGTVRLNMKQASTEKYIERYQSKPSEKANVSSDESSNQLDDPLPKGDIRWGFLKLDAERGSFVIDQTQVDTHIQELRHQLKACKSVFAWVQAWNTYFARFFSNNFATPSVCFGRAHIDMVISTLRRIENEVFANDGHSDTSRTAERSVTGYLRKVIAERFNVHDLPEGFFYFPVELGGLQLHNPFISFLGLREGIKQTPQRIIQLALLREEECYHRLKESYEKSGSPQSDRGGKSGSGVEDTSAFLPLDEYMLHLESTSSLLFHAYENLLHVPQEVPVQQTPELQRSQTKLGEANSRQSNGSHSLESDLHSWQDMTPYWKWVAELYHTGMIYKYGGLAAVDRALMPLGVVKVLRQRKVRWQG